MADAKHVQPTEAELAILRVLWERGPSTVRDVHEALGGDERTRYTTTLKQMQVMAEKRLVKRNASQKTHVYAAVAQEQKTESRLVSNFLDRVFGGSVQKMVIHALQSGKVSSDELAEIKRVIREWEKRK